MAKILIADVGFSTISVTVAVADDANAVTKNPLTIKKAKYAFCVHNWTPTVDTSPEILARTRMIMGKTNINNESKTVGNKPVTKPNNACGIFKIHLNHGNLLVKKVILEMVPTAATGMAQNTTNAVTAANAKNLLVILSHQNILKFA